MVRRCFLAKEGGRMYRQEQEWEDQVWGERIWEEQVWGEPRPYFDRPARREGEGLESKWKELETIKVEKVPGCLGKTILRLGDV